MLLRMPAFMPSGFRVSAPHRPLRAHAEAHNPPKFAGLADYYAIASRECAILS